MEAHASLAAIAEALTDYRRPIAYFLLGDFARVEQVMTGRGGVADADFRAEMRRRMEAAK